MAGREIESRAEIIGKRIVSVVASECETGIKWIYGERGVVRACSHNDPTNHQSQVLIEFDGFDWQQREWLSLHESFSVLLVETRLVWAARCKDHIEPALMFSVFVDKLNYSQHETRTLCEFLSDKQVILMTESNIKPLQMSDLVGVDVSLLLKTEICRWFQFQDSQFTMLHTPNELVGHRVKVYCKHGSTQWYTGVIQHCNPISMDLNVSEDTVHKAHTIHPACDTIYLLGHHARVGPGLRVLPTGPSLRVLPTGPSLRVLPTGPRLPVLPTGSNLPVAVPPIRMYKTCNDPGENSTNIAASSASPAIVSPINSVLSMSTLSMSTVSLLGQQAQCKTRGPHCSSVACSTNSVARLTLGVANCAGIIDSNQLVSCNKTLSSPSATDSRSVKLLTSTSLPHNVASHSNKSLTVLHTNDVVFASCTVLLPFSAKTYSVNHRSVTSLPLGLSSVTTCSSSLASVATCSISVASHSVSCANNATCHSSCANSVAKCFPCVDSVAKCFPCADHIVSDVNNHCDVTKSQATHSSVTVASSVASHGGSVASCCVSTVPFLSWKRLHFDSQNLAEAKKLLQRISAPCIDTTDNIEMSTELNDKSKRKLETISTEQRILKKQKIHTDTVKLLRNSEQKLTLNVINNTTDNNTSVHLQQQQLNSDLSTLPVDQQLTRPIFVQDGRCADFSPFVSCCGECQTSNKSICRFIGFRKLQLTSTGSLVTVGFSHPSDAERSDIEPYAPETDRTRRCRMSVSCAVYIIEHVARWFHRVVDIELEAQKYKNVGCVTSVSELVWKRCVPLVREMCDSCQTTLFNIHWTCLSCGFSVCLDCYCTALSAGAGAGTCSSELCGASDRHCLTCSTVGRQWSACTNNCRHRHTASQLTLTQILPSDVLYTVQDELHRMCDMLSIDINHSSELCPYPLWYPSSPCNEPGTGCLPCNEPGTSCCSISSSSQLKLCHQTSKMSSQGHQQFMGQQRSQGSMSTGLRSDRCSQQQQQLQQQQQQQQQQYTVLKEITKYLTGSSLRCHPLPAACTISLPLSPTVSLPQHCYHDSGRLLQLFESNSDASLPLFRRHWQQSGPVIVSGCQQLFHSSLWQPDTFISMLGDRETDLVDCGNNVVLRRCSMKEFWEGFNNVSERMCDEAGRPRILKLKDWPPAEDLADVLPSHFADIMNSMSFRDYTHRAGVFNLVSHLPDYLDCPDLGPKLYVAYGSALHPTVGSTNLHLDISDAANLMLLVAAPVDDDNGLHQQGAIEAMRLAGCCEQTMRRAVEGREIPGALWHIYSPDDNEKIRQLLRQVASERGDRSSAHHDPINDQSWYLDETLRQRLESDYHVNGCTFVQFLGDTVFIPAGAAHQVRNLHSCLKAAEDFVSPEHLEHCLNMTQEFRHLSNTHNNHEDKLQIKNVIYHSIKEALSVLKPAQ